VGRITSACPDDPFGPLAERTLDTVVLTGVFPGEDTLLIGAEFPRYPLTCPAPAWMLSSSKHERI